MFGLLKDIDLGKKEVVEEEVVAMEEERELEVAEEVEVEMKFL
jgi:hypothetical protein